MSETSKPISVAEMIEREVDDLIISSTREAMVEDILTERYGWIVL